MEKTIYKLADRNNRLTVDLTLYSDEITAAVHMQNADAKVVVLKDGFYTIPSLSKYQVIQISQVLRQGSLKGYTSYRPCLFNGHEMDIDPDLAETATHGGRKKRSKSSAAAETAVNPLNHQRKNRKEPSQDQLCQTNVGKKK